MKTKHFIIIFIILAVVVAGYFMYKKRESAVSVDPVQDAWEKAVAKEIAWMKNDPKTVELVKSKATTKGISYDQSLRQEAEYYAAQKVTKPV